MTYVLKLLRRWQVSVRAYCCNRITNKFLDNFIHDRLISDPTYKYDDVGMESKFSGNCSNTRETYDENRLIRRDCKDYNKGPLSEVPAALRLQPGQVDETDERWNNVNGVELRKSTRSTSKAVQKSPECETPKPKTKRGHKMSKVKSPKKGLFIS